MKNILTDGFLTIGGILLMQIKRVNDLFLSMGCLSDVPGFGFINSESLLNSSLSAVIDQLKIQELKPKYIVEAFSFAKAQSMV